VLPKRSTAASTPRSFRVLVPGFHLTADISVVIRSGGWSAVTPRFRWAPWPPPPLCCACMTAWPSWPRRHVTNLLSAWTNAVCRNGYTASADELASSRAVRASRVGAVSRRRWRNRLHHTRSVARWRQNALPVTVTVSVGLAEEWKQRNGPETGGCDRGRRVGPSWSRHGGGSPLKGYRHFIIRQLHRSVQGLHHRRVNIEVRHLKPGFNPES
jgi:hypothetical protein